MSHRSAAQRPLPYGLVILHEDDDILIVDKPNGLLTISTAKEAERTAYFVMMDYVRGGVSKSRNRVFIVHRLDRDTSGILLFARTEVVKRQLQDNWDQVRKTYLALVNGHPAAESGVEESYLMETTALQVYSTDNPSRGAHARTAWRVLRRTPRLSLLEVDLLTGRKHQIRVHMAEMGHPVVGDTKYGQIPPRDRPQRPVHHPDHSHPSGNPSQAPIKSPLLALHSWRLELPHPTTGETLLIEAPVPRSIAGFIGGTLDGPTLARAQSRGPKTPAQSPHQTPTHHPGTYDPANPNPTDPENPAPPVTRPDFAILTVSKKGKVHRRSKEVPLDQVLCRLLYPQGTYLDHKTKQPYTGPWPQGFDPQNPPPPRAWTLNWPPPGE